MKTPLIIAATLGLAGVLNAAPDAGVLQQSATRQEQIRGEAKQLEARLDEVIADYQRNGLAKGEDFNTLKSVRATLGTLSDAEMEKVVALLNEARTQPGNSADETAKAYDGQKNISLRLKQILAAHDQQQDIDALATSLNQLADRQGANLSTALDSKQLAAQDKSAAGQTAIAASMEAQQGEQTAIAGEIQLLAGKLSQIATTSANYKDAATQLAAVQPQAAAAGTALTAGKIDDAVAGETAAREALIRIAQALSPADQKQSRTESSADQLANIAQEQRGLQQKTAAMDKALQLIAAQQGQEATDKFIDQEISKPTNRMVRLLAADGITANSPLDQIRNDPQMQRRLADRVKDIKRQQDDANQKLAALASDQQALAAKAEMVREDLAKTVPQTAAPMADALTQMNTAQNALAQGDGQQAEQGQADAAAQLDAAAKIAAQQANGPQQAQAAGTRQQQLQQLQKQAQALSQRETGSVQQADAAKTGAPAQAAAALQQDMAATAQAMQQGAAGLQSQAAAPLQAAQQAMNTAAQTMRAGGMPTVAQTAQQNAAQQLAAAAQQLGQDAAAAAQEQQQLAAVEREIQEIARLIQGQLIVNSTTDKDIGENRTGRRDLEGLSRQQGGVKNETESVLKAITVPATVAALGEAATDMADVIGKLTETTAQDAQPPEKAALAALYKAQDGLADQAQQMAQNLGEAQATPQQLAATEAELNRAQQQDGAAQQAMDQNQNPQQAVGNLAQAGQQMAAAAGQPQALPQAARDAMRQAQQALGQAQAAAQSGDQQQAQVAAQAAGQDMAAAQSAMGQMQAGVGQLTAPQNGADQQGQGQGQGQGQQPGQGQGQGMAQGQSQGAQPPQQGIGANEKNWSDQGGLASRNGQTVHGGSQFIALPERDRAALQQSQSEKYPQEYGAEVEEYMRSLASDSGDK
ncbi:MAG TPA: hypothetical protein VHY22_04170 [Chthoniobacteraceae bacterium]|jgi:hypothetical protein|nr:hypothetical protein [Chthoniobacteraceae bacterium]